MLKFVYFRNTGESNQVDVVGNLLKKINDFLLDKDPKYVVVHFHENQTSAIVQYLPLELDNG